MPNQLPLEGLAMRSPLAEPRMVAHWRDGEFTARRQHHQLGERQIKSRHELLLTPA